MNIYPEPPLPLLPRQIDALPYFITVGHWGLTAVQRLPNNGPGVFLASVAYPFGRERERTSLHNASIAFTALDAKARAEIARRGIVN